MITIAVCTNRDIKSKTLESLLNMVKGRNDIHVLVAEKGYTISENRNYCVVQAQKNKSDYLLFIDDDMTFPPETLDVLLKSDKDIVGTLSYSRVLPLSPTVGMMDENGKYMHPDEHPFLQNEIPKELFKAYFVGAGVMLIKMSVFEKIKQPYFEFTYHENGLVKDGEDGNFCNKAREAGFEIWCEPSLSIGHIGNYEYKK